MGFFRFALGQCAFIDSFNSETRAVLPEQKSGFVCSLQQEDNVRMHQGQKKMFLLEILDSDMFSETSGCPFVALFIYILFL